MKWFILVLIIALRTLTYAQPSIGNCDRTWICDTQNNCVCASKIILGGVGVSKSCTSDTCTVDTTNNVTILGNQIGESTDFAPQIDLTNKSIINNWGFTGTSTNTGTIDSSGGSEILPYNSSTAPTTNAKIRVNSTSGEVEYGYGSATSYLVPGRDFWKLGGSGVDGAFTYGGEDTSTTSHKCAANGGSASTCSGGTCSGTWPNGICTLTYNSILGRSNSLSSNTAVSVVKNYTTITITGGTVTIGTPGALGSFLVLRATGAVSLSGSGKIDVVGKGTAAATSGACGQNTGKRGGNNAYIPGGAAGASGNNAGSVGVAANSSPLVFPMFNFVNLLGTGGGAIPGTGGVAAVDLTADNGPTLGGTGGGGGGCLTGCSGTGGPGGVGGGMVRIEADSITCNTFTIDASGGVGSGGGSGGGGGGSHFLARTISETSCTRTVAGGAGASGGPTLCNNSSTTGQAGGAGLNINSLLPQ